ncbi:MAG: diacylglycerol kinase family protein [Candidatus Fermentibacteraceae bacterium]
MEYHGKWFIIVNPKAQSGGAGGSWPETQRMLEGTGLDFTHAFTDSASTTFALTLRALSEGFGGVAVFGGDGTLSSVGAVLSSVETPPVLGQIPAGSGNDWIRSLGIPQDRESAVRLLAQGLTRLVDTGVCTVSGVRKPFINSAGLGFDALVLKRTLALRKLLPLKKSGYLVSLFIAALWPPRFSATVLADGKAFHSGRYFSLTLGVGKFSGGGMSLSPTAVIDDGLLDAVRIAPVWFGTIAANIGRIFNGTLMEMKQARGARAASFIVIPEGDVLLELDGEFQTFETRPEKLSFETGPVLRVISSRT